MGRSFLSFWKLWPNIIFKSLAQNDLLQNICTSLWGSIQTHLSMLHNLYMFSRLGTFIYQLAAACSDGLISAVPSLAGKLQKLLWKEGELFPQECSFLQVDGTLILFLKDIFFLEEIQPNHTQPKVNSLKGTVLFTFTWKLIILHTQLFKSTFTYKISFDHHKIPVSKNPFTMTFICQVTQWRPYRY